MSEPESSYSFLPPLPRDLIEMLFKFHPAVGSASWGITQAASPHGELSLLTASDHYTIQDTGQNYLNSKKMFVFFSKISI